MRMEYLQTKVLDGMMEELLEEFEPMHVLDLLVQNDAEGKNQIKAKKYRKERVKTTWSILQCKDNERWLLRFAEVLVKSAWYRTLGEKLRKETECAIKEIEDLQELYSVSEESFLCLPHLLQIATAIQESDARKLLEYFKVPNTNSNDLGKTLVIFLLYHKIPMLRLKEACSKYNLKYLQDINAKHEMLLSFPEIQGTFLVELPASISHENGTSWESSLFSKETCIKLYVFFRGEYDIHFVKLCEEANTLCLRITSNRTLDKLLGENAAGVLGANVATLVYKPINGSESTPNIRLDFRESELENVRQQLSTSEGDASLCSSLASFEAGYSEEQSLFDYLDMMDRLNSVINKPDITLLCDYFKIDSKSVEKIRGSNNPKWEFIRVCRENKIWTSKDTSKLVEAVKSHQLTHLENAIAGKTNNISLDLAEDVTVTMAPTKPYHSTFTKIKQFVFGGKRVAKSEVEEKLGMNMLFKVSTAESMHKLKKDIDSGRFLQEILRVYNDEICDDTLMISEEERKSIKLTYDEKQFKEVNHGANEDNSRKHSFDYLDMMDRLIETMGVSDIDRLCKYFNMDHKSLERIQGSINPKREFLHVCRRKKIWTNGNTFPLLEAVKSTHLTRLQSIIEDFNDMSLCPGVTLTIKLNAPSASEFEEFLLSNKKQLDTELRRKCNVHLVDCEKGSIILLLKVPSKDSLDQLMGDIHSGRLLKKLMTMYNERAKHIAITILEDVKLSLKLSYDTNEVTVASNVLKQHNVIIKDQWKRALMRVQTLMEEELDPFSLMELLTSNGTLTSTEKDALEATAKRKERVRLFMSFLETKEETAFNSFCHALETCGYYEELTKALSSEVKEIQSGSFSSGDLEHMTKGSQVSAKIDEVRQRCSTEQVYFDIFVDTCGNWNIERAPTKRFVEEEQMDAFVSTHEPSKTTKEVEVLVGKSVIFPEVTSNVGKERKDMNDPYDDFPNKESFFTEADKALNGFYVKFMWMLYVLKITVSKWTQNIIHKGKLVMVPTMHLCDAVIYIGSQIQDGLIENCHYINIRRIFSNWCPQFLKSFKDAMVFFVVLSLAAIYLALTRIFQHKVPLATEAEVVRRCKDCFQQIKTMCISRHSPLILFDNDDLETVSKSEENVQRLKQNLNISQVVGSSAGIAGGVATLVGFALAPFTFGASTLLTVVGLTLSLSGATMSIGATVVNINGKKTIRKNLDVIFIKYFRLAKSIGKLVQLYVQLRDILEQLPTFPNKMELTEAMGEKMKSLSKIRHDISVLQISIEPLPDKVKNLVDIMNNLSTVVEEVIEQMHNNPDNRDEVIQKHDPVTVKDAVDIIGSDHRQQSTLLSDFILRFFGYTDANDETTDDPTDIETKMDIRPTLLIPSAKYSIVFETVDIAMELSDDIFRKASESLEVLSKIGILITALGIVIDVGVLTKSLVDLSNGSEEQLRVCFRNCRSHMELINSIPGIQRRNQEIQFFGLLFHPIVIYFIAFLLYFIFCWSYVNIAGSS